MTLNQNWVSRAVRTLKLSASGIAFLATAGGLTAGCLDRPVAPALPHTSNVVTKAVPQSGVDKIDLLFMIDNSISMADKQRILAEAVPVLVSRLVDPICVDPMGNPVGGTNQGMCPGSQPEFPPIRNIHIGVITSSLGNHGGDVCVPDPMDMTVRTLNDQAQLVGSIRPNANPALYSWTNSGFLVWDPRTGADRPTPDPHQPLGMHETNAQTLIADFQTHVQAAGERGCGYEASLESWYRFLIDPEPIATVTNDGTFSVRGPVNAVVLQQRAAFMRPDSLLAIVMLTDENDCSITDENGQQGWLVGRRIQMPRASSSCANPGTADFDKCCRPCVVNPAEGCPANAADASCAMGVSLTAAEDSTNLRCFNQQKRFGFSLLYPWQRYSNALKAPRIQLRAPDAMGHNDVQNPLYTPGTDGTPARESSLVFLAGIIGVPWQDLADDASRMMGNRGLRYLTATEIAAQGRWDVVLGDPDVNRAPTDPFMIEQVDPRTGTNPLTGDVVQPPTGGASNAINGHEQNVVGRDDLQYACTFDLVPDVPCTMANQDGCDCNASEAANNRSLCQYPAAGMDGTQVNAKAYPGVRELQVLKGYGDNAIVASICPKNVAAMGGSPAADPDYGYNPAVGAIINRLKKALLTTCLPRPLAVDANENVPCKATEAFLPPTGGVCPVCDPALGRAELNPDTATAVRSSVEEELAAEKKCGKGTGVACGTYCMCELQQLTGADLLTCQTQQSDPMMTHGYCYVDDSNPASAPLLATCPDTQRQIIRFMGDNYPRKGSTALISCLGGSVAETDGGM